MKRYNPNKYVKENYKPYKSKVYSPLVIKKYAEIAEFIAKHTATNKDKVEVWLKKHYDDMHLFDLPPVFGKYIQWKDFVKYFLHDKRIPTIREFSRLRCMVEETLENEDKVFIDKKVSEIIKLLRDSNFSNESQRKKLLDYLTSLNTSNDKRARLVYKYIGELFTDVGDEILNYFKEDEDKIMKRYDAKKHIKEKTKVYELKEDVVKFVETTYSVTNPLDAKDAMSDLCSYLIAKFPEPKSLFIIAQSVIESLNANFPDSVEYKNMKRKLAQSIMNIG